ncbi:hypothetical protein S40288_09212 [Stachybotrys chartarum IBT 40288]|nr:hypothetical protein S40288_09212 [Stachybotrys chartarum IBT 40288]
MRATGLRLAVEAVKLKGSGAARNLDIPRLSLSIPAWTGFLSRAGPARFTRPSMTGDSDACRCNEKLTLWWSESRNNGRQSDRWRKEFVSSSLLCYEDLTTLPSNKADLVVILASANRIRKCSVCVGALNRTLHMPRYWWEEYGRNANGYFGSATEANEAGSTTGLNSWARFMVKRFLESGTYDWYKIVVFVRWVASPQQTVMVLFDEPESLRETIITSLLQDVNQKDLADPFWVYPRLVDDIVRLQDESVWASRTQIRNREKGRPSMEGAPYIDFAGFHELSRHTIHVSETLTVSVKTVESILRDHHVFMKSLAPGPRAQAQTVHERLCFLEHMLASLGHRASSNNERLRSEIQLAFQTVTQYNARLSLDMGWSMRSDSAAMRTVAFLTLLFLPATFISALFSMSFFAFEPEFGWVMADEMWMFWACAGPVTLATWGLWLVLRRQWHVKKVVY